MTSIAERVERGAALLDAKQPGWWQQIDLGALDIGSRCGCIIGQLTGLTTNRGLAYEVATRRVGVGYMDEIPMGFEAPSAHGFGREHLAMPAEYAALTEAWRDLITRRREVP